MLLLIHSDWNFSSSLNPTFKSIPSLIHPKLLMSSHERGKNHVTIFSEEMKEDQRQFSTSRSWFWLNGNGSLQEHWRLNSNWRHRCHVGKLHTNSDKLFLFLSFNRSINVFVIWISREWLQTTYNLILRRVHVAGGGYSQKNWVGMCGPLTLPKTLNLHVFMTIICNFSYPMTKHLLPYLWLLWLAQLLWT